MTGFRFFARSKDEELRLVLEAALKAAQQDAEAMAGIRAALLEGDEARALSLMRAHLDVPGTEEGGV